MRGLAKPVRLPEPSYGSFSELSESQKRGKNAKQRKGAERIVQGSVSKKAKWTHLTGPPGAGEGSNDDEGQTFLRNEDAKGRNGRNDY